MASQDGLQKGDEAPVGATTLSVDWFDKMLLTACQDDVQKGDEAPVGAAIGAGIPLVTGHRDVSKEMSPKFCWIQINGQRIKQ